MTQNEKILATFETRVRQLILRFQELKEENQELGAAIEKNEKDIKSLQARLDKSGQDYNALKMAKMLEITDGDLQSAKDRLARLIREVNKCIAVMSGGER